MNRKRIYTGAAVCLLLLFTACDMMGPELDRIPGPEGKAAVLVRIAAAGISGRTVAPDAALEEVTSWELWGGKQGEAESRLAEFSGTEGTTVYLDPGVWHFTLKGYKEGLVILTGTIPEQTIGSTDTNSLNFIVEPVLDGQGILSIIINLPEGSGVTAARIVKDGTELEPSPGSPFTPVNNQIVFEREYPAGDYYFSFQLYNGSDLYGVVSEIVQVRANLRSEKTYTLSLEDLNRTYIITYHVMDGDTETGYYRYTDLQVTLTVPSREGYVFEGWYDNADLNGEPVTMVPAGSLGDKEFYARWTFVPGLQSPSAPSDITAVEDTATSVRLSWSAVPNAVTYKIYYGTAPEGVTTLAGSTAATTYRVDNLLSWTRYYFAVSSLDSEGVEGAKSTAEVTATPRDPNGTISNITYSSVLGGTWTVLADGRRQSPAVDHNNTAKARISFTSNTPNTSITIRLEVSSEQRYDVAFISTLDNGSATYSSGYYEGSRISGTQSVTVTIPVPTAGSHFIDIGYGKDSSITSGSDCAWFMVVSSAVSAVSVHVDLRPVTEDPTLSNASFFGNEAAQFSAGSGYDSYAWYWNGAVIDGAVSSTYTLAAYAKTPGIYELSVIVTSRGGERFSARVRVVIKSY